MCYGVEGCSHCYYYYSTSWELNFNVEPSILGRLQRVTIADIQTRTCHAVLCPVLLTDSRDGSTSSPPTLAPLPLRCVLLWHFSRWC